MTPGAGRLSPYTQSQHHLVLGVLVGAHTKPSAQRIPRLMRLSNHASPSRASEEHDRDARLHQAKHGLTTEHLNELKLSGELSEAAALSTANRCVFGDTA